MPTYASRRASPGIASGAPREPGVHQSLGAAVRRRAGSRHLPTHRSARRVLHRRRPGRRAMGIRSSQAGRHGYRYAERFGRPVFAAGRRRACVRRARIAAGESAARHPAGAVSLARDFRRPDRAGTGARRFCSARAGGAATLAGNLNALSDGDRRALAASVSEEATRMSERITTLLDLVRLETGAIQPRIDLYALDELVGSVLHRLEQPLRRHRVRIELPDSLPLLRVDGRLIEQVLENLLDNAAKYTPAGSEIRISAQALSRQVEVSIEDDGPGLTVADPEILFEKFQRGTPEGAVGGIGLGLAICRTILALHKGRIWAEDRSPHGAALRFTVPLPAIALERAAEHSSSGWPTLPERSRAAQCWWSRTSRSCGGCCARCWSWRISASSK